jgi:hypothetical protein
MIKKRTRPTTTVREQSLDLEEQPQQEEDEYANLPYAPLLLPS